MKHIIILGDGMADHAVECLGRKTLLQYADTEYMDMLARQGRTGRLITVPEGYAPGSEVANTAILGYDLDKVYEGRGPLEAASIGYEMAENDLAIRCNIITLADGKIKNHHGGHLTTEQGDMLIKYLDEHLGNDPVRFITNHSSGKMGYAIAKVAAIRGAEVTLVSGPVSIKPFVGIDKVDVVSAADMFEAVAENSNDSDIIIMCSAVADYTPADYSEQKMKKADLDLSLSLARTKDILKYLGEHKKQGQKIVGFSMETENLIENSRKKLEKKNADLICANSINGKDTGFGVDTNRVTLISAANTEELPLCSKEETAALILQHIMQL